MERELPVKLRNRVETMGLTATLGPFVGFNSSSRVQMLASHVTQTIPPAQSDIPRTMTGFETQLADFTFGIRMPTDGMVVSIHKKYQQGIGYGAITKNPLTTIIYQCQETGEFDYINVYEYHSRHKTFGMKYIISPLVERLKPGMPIPKDTVLAWSPNIKEGGVYSTSMETNVAYLSIPCVIEDGFGVSRSYCKRASPMEMGSSVVEWGRNFYPLNLYGDDYHYKPFPDIGECVREDGLVFALREFDPMFDAINMTPKALRRVDFVHDKRVYGIPGARVYDIQVETGIGESRSKAYTPKGMEVQAMKYIDSASLYYRGIKSEYDRLVKENPRGIAISPKLQALVTRAIADKPNDVKHPMVSKNSGMIRRTVRNKALDEYMVEVKYEKVKTIDLGSKLTDFHGGKGVICAILPDEVMPVDADGNVADVIAFFKGGVSRLNPGQFYEHYVNAASRDITKWVRSKYGTIDNATIWGQLMAYYKAAAPKQAALVEKNYISNEQKDAHIRTVVESGVYLYISPDEDHLGPKMYEEIEKVVSPTYGHVTYTDIEGKQVVTKDKVFIGVKQMIILEKTDMKPMAVSSGTLQHHGLLSGSNKESRNAHPSKQQSTRVFGETELRLYAAGMGGDTMAELMDLANNPESHREAIREIMHAACPSQIDSLVDRSQHPIGGSRSLAFVSNVLTCAGVTVVDD